ncbi:MAG: chorismate--pyruvate lyase family protein [Janthinobacterium lividum]
MSAGGARWRVLPGPLLSPDQKDWVSRGGSLTAHLARLGPVSVRVLRETIAAAWPDETASLRPMTRGNGARHRASRSGRAAHSSERGARSAGSVRSARSAPATQSTRPLRVWTREVLLSVGGVPCVAAHSVTPVAHSHGVWKSMRVLRTRPLADLLYHDRAVRRSLLVSRRLTVRRAFSATDPLAGLPHDIGGDAGESQRPGSRRYRVVARRSLFERRGAPLLITECFLPDLWHLLANRRLSR